MGGAALRCRDRLARSGRHVRSRGESSSAPDHLTTGTAVVPGLLSTALLAGRLFGTPNFGTAAKPFVLTSQGDADGFLVQLGIAGGLSTKP